MKLFLEYTSIIICIYAAYSIFKLVFLHFKQRRDHQNLLKKGKAFIEERNLRYKEFMERNKQLIPSEKIQNMILKCTSLRQLQDGLERKTFSSVDLVMHYAYRCQSYGMQLNLITQTNFEFALELAEKFDRLRTNKSAFYEYKKGTSEDGLFIGIPISFKDHLYLKGTK